MDSSKIRHKKEASKMPSANQIQKNNATYRGVDGLKHQIGKLTSDLSSERTRNRELHREKLAELKWAKNELDIHKEKTALIIKTLDSNVDSQLLPRRDSTFHKQTDYSWDESKRSPDGGEVTKSQVSSSSSHRPLSSVYASTIANLQQELHLLRDSKSQLEQRLAGIEEGSAVLYVKKEKDFTPDQSFMPFDRSYNGFDSSLPSMDDNFFNATPSSASPQLFRHRTSDTSYSTFVNEPELERDQNAVRANRQSQSISSAGSDQSVDKQGKYDSEKQWQLQKKVLDLNAQSAQLEKRITALKEENDVLKKKTEEQKENEEKIKKLKRRNAELASIARRLEDKMKQLQQQDNQKKVLAASPSVEGNLKQMAQNKTRTKDRTINKSKVAVDKDKLIDVMKERFQELLRQNRSTHAEDLLNKDFYAEQMELENIIKVAAKERLQLEKQLVDEQHNLEIEAQLTRAVHLERRNAELMDEVERLTKFADEREKLEIEVMQRRIEVETLEQQVTEADEKCARLADELQDLIVRNTQLTVVNTDVERQIEELDQMARNYKSLSTSLAAAESELLKAKAEAASSFERVQTLEVELQYMGQVEQKKRQLELEKQSLQESLRLRQQELDAVNQDREADRTRNTELLTNLELRLSEIENMYEEQLRINEQISRELNDVRASNREHSDRPTRKSIEVQTELDLPVTVSRQSLLAHEAVNGDISPTSKDQSHSKSKTVVMDVNRNRNSQCANNIRLTDLISKDDFSRSLVLHEAASHSMKGTGVNGSPVENGYADDAMLNNEILDDQESLIQVFQAIFDYDPDQSSPNEEPEQELVLTAGDYMFVYNNMDEDGFYLAELLDGRQGLVPSNFVRRVTGQELVEFYAAINMDMQGDAVESHSSGTNPLLDFSGNEEDSNQRGIANAKRFSSEVPEDVDRSLDVSFTNDSPELRQLGIPDAPVSVQVESGPDHGCLMVSWLPVTITTAGTSNGARVAGYYIFIDGNKVKTLSNPTGDHVLLESDDLCLIDNPRCVTVRTIAVSGQESSDSLPAFIFPHLVQELKAGSSVSTEDENMPGHEEREDEYASDQDSGSETERPETANHSKDLRLIPQPLQSDNGGRSLDVENANLSNNQLNGMEQIEDLDDHQPKEIIRTENLHHSIATSSDHSSFLSLQKPKSPVLVPTTAASEDDAAIRNNSDGALKGAFKSTVWKKVEPKTKQRTKGDAVDLNSVDYDERTWKSLDSGNKQVLSSKSQSHECLSSTQRSGWAKNSSMLDISSKASTHQTDKSAADTKETREGVEMQTNLCSVLVGTSLIAKDELQQHPDSQDIDNAAGKRPGVSRGGHSRDFSTSSDVSANNGISLNELDDAVSSGSELVDNNMMTSKKIRDDIPDSELIDYSDDGGESLVESVECDRDAQVRIFIALFSYDPETMSPNPDALTEELPFREGQIIKIYGDKDEDGFFMGEINHQRGLIPCNMVSEVHINDPEIAAQLLEESRRPASQSAGSSRTSSRTSDFTSRTHSTISILGGPDDERLSPVGEPSDVDDNVPERYVIALYNYDPQELSPNTDVDEELSFQKDDIIKVFGDVDEDGFYYGQLNDRYGLVPSNFIKDAPSSAVYYAVAMQNRPSL